MKDIVYFPHWWQPEYICHRRDDLSDFKWTFSSGSELLKGVTEF